MHTLVLFDIDGTLVRGGPAKVAFETAMLETYGTAGAVTDRLTEIQEALNLDQFMFEVNYGSQIPQERQHKSLRLFMENVAPSFR